MWKAQFQVSYNMGGGASLDWTERTTKKKFMFILGELKDQIRKENNEMKKSSRGSTAKAPTGKMKYLGGK